MTDAPSPLPDPKESNGVWAAAYARLGIPVFPLHALRTEGHCTCTRGSACGRDTAKHPLTPHGVLAATTDLTVIAGWWRRWPWANIGAATGYVSDVLDLDGIDAGAWQRLPPGYRLPPTLRSRTGSGGEHWHFQPAPGLKNGVKRLPHADTRAKGGYVLLPPSRNRNGAYVWLAPPGSVALAPWPADLLAALRPPPSPPPKMLPKPASLATTIPESLIQWADRGAALGQQTHAAFWLACRLRQHGASDSDALRVLGRFARSCSPPADWDKVQRIWRDSARYQGYDPALRLPQATYQAGQRLEEGKYQRGRLL